LPIRPTTKIRVMRTWANYLVIGASYLDESDSDSGDEDVIMTPPAPVLSTPAPLPAPDLSTEVALFVASVAPYQPARESESDFIWRTLSSAPFTVLERGRLLTSILFSDGRTRVMATANVDAFRRYVAVYDAAPASVSLPPRPPPAPSRTPSPLFSPAPNPAYVYRPSWQPFRPATPFDAPASPPTPDHHLQHQTNY
jgi:hypothetical protein